MICPACEKEFKGGRFWRSGVNGAMRQCAHCDHQFKEPPRKRKPDPRDEEVKRLREALQGLHDDVAEYQRLNNLGGYDNHWMVAARSALKPRIEK